MAEQEDAMLRQAVDWDKNAVETYNRRRRPSSSMNNGTKKKATKGGRPMIWRLARYGGMLPVMSLDLVCRLFPDEYS